MELENESDESNQPDVLYVVIFLFGCIIGILSNLFIIYHIVHRRIKSVVKTYFLLWCIVNTLFLAVMPGVITPSLSHEFQSTHHWFMVITLQISSILEIVDLLLALVMCVLWFLAMSNKKVQGRFKITLSIIWLIAFIYCVTSMIQCIHGDCLNADYLSMFLYGILLLLLIFMYIIKFILVVRNESRIYASNFILLMVTSYVLCWFPTWFCILLYIFKTQLDWLNVYLIALCVGSLNSFLNLVLFVFLNKHFRIRLVQSFRCFSSGYIEAEESFSDSDVNFNEYQVTSV